MFPPSLFFRRKASRIFRLKNYATDPLSFTVTFKENPIPSLSCKQICWSFIFLLTLIPGICRSAQNGFCAEEVLTNDSLHEFIGDKPHTVLAAQRERFGKILEAFIAEDWDKIQSISGDVLNDLNQFLSNSQNMQEKKDDQIKAVHSLQVHTQMLKSGAATKDYQESYKQFTAMTQLCMRCHQEQNHLATPQEDSSPLQVTLTKQ